MVNATIQNELRQIIAEILETVPEKIQGDAQFVKDLEMDSMMALEVMALLEKRYKIVIPEEDLSRFTSLNNSVQVVSDIMGGR
jgi:acyl carrier protein